MQNIKLPKKLSPQKTAMFNKFSVKNKRLYYMMIRFHALFSRDSLYINDIRLRDL